MKSKEGITEEHALVKLTALCAKSEYCKEDMRIKMRRWNIEESIQQRILDYLIKEKYIDESRFSRLFIENKIKYNKWGKKKVEQALYAKKISEDIYSPILKEFSDDEYKDILLPLLIKKEKSIKAENNYERNGKLIRFAMQRGFLYEEAKACLEEINKK